MRQRVGIARALAVDPAVLLMDEPFSALDAQTRALMMEELLGIWEATRKSILYVTHNIQEAVFMADRVVVLSRRPGRVLDVAKIELGAPAGRGAAGGARLRRGGRADLGADQVAGAGRPRRGGRVMAVERVTVSDRAAFLVRREYRAVRVLALVGLVALWEALRAHRLGAGAVPALAGRRSP